jgi:hypothetical protein
MDIEALYKVCQEAMDKGMGKCPVYFDSCADTFDCHMVLIEDAFAEDLEEARLGKFLSLHYGAYGSCRERTKNE